MPHADDTDAQLAGCRDENQMLREQRAEALAVCPIAQRPGFDGSLLVAVTETVAQLRQAESALVDACGARDRLAEALTACVAALEYVDNHGSPAISGYSIRVDCIKAAKRALTALLPAAAPAKDGEP